MKALSENERMFLDAYISSGNATESAIAAGYSPATAKQMGYKVLHRSHVQEELNRRVGAMPRRVTPPPAPPKKPPPNSPAGAAGEPEPPNEDDFPEVEGRLIVVQAPPLEGEVFGPEEGRVNPDDDAALVATLTPDWMLARLMRTAMRCGGELEQTLVKIVQKTDTKGRTVITAAQIKAMVFDPTGLVQAMNQIAKLTGALRPLDPPDDTDEVSRLPGRAEQQAALDAFDVLAQRYRDEAAAKARAGTNGHAKPNGSTH